jgi:hypothetical protein
MSEQYVGFYTSNVFWVDSIPDFDTISQNPKSFKEALSEQVFVHSTDDYTLKVCKDGLFMVRIEAMEKVIRPAKGRGSRVRANGKYYDYLNALQFLFSGVLLTHHKRDIGVVGLRIGDAFRVGDGGLGGGSKNSLSTNVRLLSTYGIGLPVEIDFRILQRFVNCIPVSVFDEVVVEFEKVRDDYDRVKVLSQIMVVVGSYQLLNFTASLIQAWFVIEYFVNVYWFNFLKDHQMGFGADGQWKNSKAHAFFSGKDFTASIMSQMLDFGGCIDHDIFNKIDKVRKKRNQIVHSSEMVGRFTDGLKKRPTKQQSDDGMVVTDLDCGNAFDVICYFLKELYEVDLRISKGFGYNPL